jgi:hypothetical protein
VPPEAFAKHRLLCGNAAQFQGDERDVIFLSRVEKELSSLVSKIQSGPSNGSLALEAIIGATNFGRGFFDTSLYGPVSNQELL